MKSTSFTGYWVARQQWSTVQSICCWRNLLVCVSVLTGHVQQHYWHYIVGKFRRYIRNCLYTLIYLYTVVLPHPQHLCSLQQCIIIFCQSNKATLPIHIGWLLMTVRGLLQDWSFHSIYDVRWRYCQLFSSLHSDSLVISCVADLKRGIQHNSDLFSLHAKVSASTLVVAINLVTCFSFLNNPWIADVSYLRCTRACAKCGCRIFAPK